MTEELAVKYNQAAITPFWRKLPFFILFPFRFGPLVFMVCIVAASALAGLLLGGFGLVFKGFLAYLGLRYAFNVLELFAKGRFEGESVDHRLWGPEKRPAKLGMVITLFVVAALVLGNMAVQSRIDGDERAQDQLIERYQREHADELAELAREQAAYQQQLAEHKALTLAAQQRAREREAQDGEASPLELYADEPPPEPPRAAPTRAEMIQAVRVVPGDPLWLRLQPAWYWLLMLLLSLLLPSAAVVIALEDNLPRALNPLNAVHLMQALGRAYVVLWVFFLAILGARQLALTAGEHLPVVLRFPLEMGVATYLGLVLFALMGYALYQYHQELHLDVAVDFDQHREAGGAEAIAKAGSAAKARMERAQPIDPLQRKVEQLVQQGNVKEAIAEVKDEMRYDRLDPALNTQLHRLYLLQGDPAVTLAHGQQWLTALARAGRGKEALSAWQALQAIDPHFTAQDGAVVLPAAQAAYQQGDAASAAALMRSFDKRFPSHPDTPGVFFLGARMMSEQMRQHDKAARTLRAVLAHFPGHAIESEVRTYLQVLESMPTQAQAGTR